MTESGSQDIFIHYGSNRYEGTFWQPKFLDERKFIMREYGHAWKTYLIRKNLEQMEESFILHNKTIRFSFYSKVIVKRVFDICKLMKQPPEIRYLALSILDRFMIYQFVEISHNIKVKGGWNNKTWKVIKRKMVNESFLRIISSIQLASKYCSSIQSLSSRELQIVLNSSIQNNVSSSPQVINLSNLYKSEAKVFQTISCKIPIVTPLTYIEMFCEDFKKEEIENNLHLTISSFFNVCIDVLDVSIVYHKEIFQNHYAKFIQKSYFTHINSRISSLEGDYLYLATAVIYTSAALQDPSLTVCYNILQSFSLTTEYKSEEIEILGNAILDIILK